MAVQRRSIEARDAEALFLEQRERIHALCYAILRDSADADDAVQEAFARAAARLDRLVGDPVAYLVVVARNVCRDELRRRSRSAGQFIGSASWLRSPEQTAVDRGVLGSAWHHLDAEERAIVAYSFSGFSLAEIAQRIGTSVDGAAQRLSRARRRARQIVALHDRPTRGPSLPVVIVVAGWRRFGDLWRRLRNSAYSASTAVNAQPIPVFTFSVAVAGLIAAVNPAVSIPSTSAKVPPVALVGPVAGGEGERAVSAAEASAGLRVGASSSGASSATAHLAGAAAPPSDTPTLLGGANAETPEDTRLYSAAPSPHFADDHTIVALGQGRGCLCGVLLRSTDGGATWTARQGPPSGDQVVLPPDYPDDARIFVGTRDATSTSADYWAPRFGAAFLPLVVPAGSLALPAGFDSGDMRVIVSSSYAIWSLDWATQVAQPIVLDTSTTGSPAVAAPAGGSSEGVLGITSAGALAPGGVANPVAASDENTLWTCPPVHTCMATTDVSVGPWAQLSASPDYAVDRTLIAYSGARLLMSTDGGAHFESVQRAPGGENTNLAVLGFPAGGAPTLWTLVLTASRRYALEYAPAPNAPWREVDDGLGPIIDGYGQIVPIGPRTVIFLSSAHGLLCTANDGMSWSTRCPTS